MDGKSGNGEIGGSVPSGRVVVDAAEGMVGILLAEALRTRGLDSEVRADSDGSIPDDAIAILVPPSSVVEFHSDGWSSRIRAVPVDVPLVVIGRPTSPIHAVIDERRADRGLALLDSRSLDDADSLQSVVSLVGDGMRIIDPGFIDPAQSRAGSIGEAERSVLDLVVNGYSNHAIADELFLSVRTVESHVRNLMRRFGIDGSPRTNRRVLLARAALAGSRTSDRRS